MAKHIRKIAAVVILAGGGWFAYHHFHAAKPGATPAVTGEMPPLPVRAVAVQKNAIAETVTVIATLKPAEMVMIAPEIAGRVTAIHFREGDKVQAGQNVVTLDSAMQKSALQAAQARLSLSNHNSKRSTELLQEGFATRATMDEMNFNRQDAEAMVSQAKTMLEKTDLLAPFSGVLGLRSISPGAYVMPGESIVTLYKLETLKTDFAIPERFAAKITVGAPVTLVSSALPGQKFTATVTAIEPAIDEMTRSLNVRAEIDNKDGLLKPGMLVDASLLLAQNADALTVPEEALVPLGGDSVGVMVIRDGVVNPVGVTTGLRQPGTVEILSGVAAGDMVVTEGQIKLQPGAKVMVLPDSPVAAATSPE